MLETKVNAKGDDKIISLIEILIQDSFLKMNAEQIFEISKENFLCIKGERLEGGKSIY